MKLLVNIFTLVVSVLFFSYATSALALPKAEFSGSIDLELTGYEHSPLYDSQHEGMHTALTLTPKLELSNSGEIDTKLTFSPYLRLDETDNERSMFDLREAKLDFDFGGTAITLGNDYVFWGKTESGRIVDIINQKNLAAGSDDEDKLGQPMLKISHVSDHKWGVLATDAYYMPYFRERQFVGSASRGRGSTVVDMDNPIFLDGTSKKTPSYALRFDVSAGNADLGLSGFKGLSRDPSFSPNATTALSPIYGEIEQIGLDGQITHEDTLFKFEAIKRANQVNRLGEKESYDAVTLGMEHTLHGINKSNADLGLILEHTKDDRGKRALSPLENDTILGARLTLNNHQDSSALATLAIDNDSSEKFLHFELEHRLTNTLSASVEANKTIQPANDSLLYDARQDNNISLSISTSW